MKDSVENIAKLPHIGHGTVHLAFKAQYSRQTTGVAVGNAGTPAWEMTFLPGPPETCTVCGVPGRDGKIIFSLCFSVARPCTCRRRGGEG